MPALRYGDELSGSRQVFLILRLVLDRQARLRHGELLDEESTSLGRFLTVTGLTDEVAGWLDRQARECSPPDEAP